MMRLIYLSVLFLFALSSCDKVIKPIQVGQRVPEYTFEKVIGDEITDFSLSDLKGKTVILEYWATWCSPCVPAMRKLDSLKNAFGNNVEVIAISEEDPERISQFMNRTNWDITYVSDSASNKLFPHRIIPHSVIIDATGVVRAITSPSNITAEVLRNVVEGREVLLETKDDFYVDPLVESALLKQESHKGYSISLYSHKQQQRGGFEYHKDQGEINGVSMWNSTIPRMYQTIFEVDSPNRMIFEAGMSYKDFPYEPEHLYNLEIYTAPEYRDQWKELGIAFLNNYFDVNGKMTLDTLSVYELVQTKPALSPSEAAKTSSSFNGPHFYGKAIPISRLTDYLENFLDKPVVDQTGLAERYDIQFDWAFEEQGSLQKALDTYGFKLQVSEEEVPLEVLRIYRKSLITDSTSTPPDSDQNP